MKLGNKNFIVRMALVCLCVCFMASGKRADAAGTILPTAEDNLTVGLRSTSRLAATDSGYMRVFYDGKKIGIEYYDDAFQIQGKKTVEMELPVWGGFYAGEDAYYLAEGQDNKAEKDTAEVIRVIKYDKNWNRVGAANITGNTELFGGEVRYPFDYGCVEMTECKGKLYLVTGHEGYVDAAVGQGHQGFLMVEVNESDMTGKIIDSDLWHSFAQYIACKDNELYVLEQSEGSRYTKISKCEAGKCREESAAVLKYGGSRDSAWAIACYASVDGLALSSDHVLCLGTSIDQSNYENVSEDTPHNLYLTVTPMGNISEEATTVKWLTNYKGGGKCFLGAKITKVTDDRFLISWEEFGQEQEADVRDTLSSSILHYMFVDGQGNPVSKEFTAAAPISDCQPIVKGSQIVYDASNANMVNFYSIDAVTGAFVKKAYRIAGEQATWDLKKGVLTIAGEGIISVNAKENFREPISSTAGWFSYSSDDNAWKAIRDHVKKLIVEKGITGISEGAFRGFTHLTEVEIQPGVKSIGKEAFRGCNDLAKIKIPSSVTKIGEDFLWTGYYWTSDGSHVVKATIYAPENSYAMNYAKKNKISYVADNTLDDGESILKAKVSGIKKTYAYNGKERKPKVTVKLNSKKLTEGKDYKVSYTKNKNTGKATVKIKGIGAYSGTVVKTFRIVPKKAALLKVSSPKAGMLKITWKKDPQASGYQLQYAKNAKFTKGKGAAEIAKKSVGAKKISGLTKKGSYYVRVRAYKKIGKEKCYGAWSKKVKKKCK